MQEVFLDVWQKPGVFDPARGSLRAFLGTLTHHAAVGWVRRQAAAHRREHAAAPLATTVDDVEETAIARIAAMKTRAALAVLPLAQRRAVVLAYFYGLTYRQVRRHLRRARGHGEVPVATGFDHFGQSAPARGRACVNTSDPKRRSAADSSHVHRTP